MGRSKGKSARADRADQKLHETPLEAESRKEANFAEVESMLPKRFDRSEMGFIDKSTSEYGLFPICT